MTLPPCPHGLRISSCEPCRRQYRREWRAKRLLGLTAKREPCAHGLFVTNCKPCRRKYKTAKQIMYNARNRAALAAQGLKRCNACKTDKPFDQFYPDATKPDGHASPCKTCKDELRRKRYMANLERERQRSRDYYAATKHGLLRSRALRQRAIEIYGGQCDKCGDIHDLEFDHINGDGAQHRKVESHHHMIKRIVETGAPIKDYQLRLLCKRCHRADRAYRMPMTGSAISQSRLMMWIATSNDWPVLTL